MNDLSSLYQRTNLQSLRAFLKDGEAPGDPDCGTGQERLEDACLAMRRAVERLVPSVPEREELIGLTCFYADLCGDVYLETGIRAGARLMLELVGERDG